MTNSEKEKSLATDKLNAKNIDINNNTSNENYLNLLEQIKYRVELEENNERKNEDTLEDTVIIDRNELNKALGLENTKLADNQYVEDEFELTGVVPFDELASESSSTTYEPVYAQSNFSNEYTNEEVYEEAPAVKENYYGNVVLEVMDLKKRIGLKTIVEDITFDMREGEIIGLLGPNGSGKTTIMRMLVGLTKATKGEIYCFEKRLGLGHNKMLSEVGAMIESPEFYNYMSGYANLKQLARMSKKKITRSKIKELLKFVGLEKVARKKVKTYSLGMRQRLGLAQALLHDPKILILDEPVNGLDPQGVQDFRNKLKEIAATGVSILISSHLLDEIEKVSDRIIVLEKGRIIADDTLENLCSEDIERTVIDTYDNGRARVLLDDLDVPFVELEDGFVFENISQEDKARVVSYFVNSHVQINTIKIIKKTLEERFLEITGTGGNN